MNDKRDVGPLPEPDGQTAKARRNLFVAETGFINIRICEALPDDSFRVLLWGKITKAERHRGDEFVKLLGPDAETLACAGACAWRSPNLPKTAEVATALEDFVDGLERRHGVGHLVQVHWKVLRRESVSRERISFKSLSTGYPLTKNGERPLNQ